MTKPKQCLQKCMKVNNSISELFSDASMVLRGHVNRSSRSTQFDSAGLRTYTACLCTRKQIKTKHNRQNLQESASLVKSKKPLGCLISKLCALLLT